ncbi:MAG TPA: hypothetical protein VFV71_00460 [Burkholderiales bacterium]|nr:hypothetical protein [Burkholderiales bacterium]
MLPLIAAAALSVVAFSGIGVAAITGHLSLTRSSLNPFASFNRSAASGLIQAPIITDPGHQGLTRKRGQTPAAGKPVTFRAGARVPAKKSVCQDCGVVDSIRPGRARSAVPGIPRSMAADSEGTGIARVDRETNERPSDDASGYVVRVQMENGTVRTIYETERPAFDVGERIKLVNGAVMRQG